MRVSAPAVIAAAACLSLSLLWQTAGRARAQEAKSADSVDVRGLLSEVARNERAMLARRLEYTWTAKMTDRKLGNRGEVKKESTSVYEVYPLRGEFARKLVSKDGVHVSRERGEKELKGAAERMEKAAREERKGAESKTPPPPTPTVAQTQNPEGLPSFGFSTGHRESNGLTSSEISVAVWRFFRYCEFRDARAETLNGRDSIVLDFRPRADFRPADDLQKPYAHLSGRLWIDASERAVARLEAWPDGATAGAAREPSIVFEHARVAEGLWLERLVRIKTYGHKQIFNGIELDFTKEVTDFKRFSSLAGDDRVDPPPEKP